MCIVVEGRNLPPSPWELPHVHLVQCAAGGDERRRRRRFEEHYDARRDELTLGVHEYEYMEHGKNFANFGSITVNCRAPFQNDLSILLWLDQV